MVKRRSCFAPLGKVDMTFERCQEGRPKSPASDPPDKPLSVSRACKDVDQLQEIQLSASCVREDVDHLTNSCLYQVPLRL